MSRLGVLRGEDADRSSGQTDEPSQIPSADSGKVGQIEARRLFGGHCYAVLRQEARGY